MSFFLRVLPRISSQAASLCKSLAQPSFVNVQRSIHMNSPVLSLTNLSMFDKRGLEIKRKALESDPNKSADKLKQALNDASKLSETELAATVRDFSLVLSTDEDLKLSIQLLKDQKPSNVDAIVAVSTLYKRAVELNKRELFIEAFEKYPIFRNNYGFNVIASHYLVNNELDKVISLFEAYMPRYLEPTYLKQEQKIPFGHLQFMTTVYLKKNTSESLGKLKDLINLTQVYKSELGCNSKAHIIGLSIFQNDNKFAEECLDKFQISSFNTSLNVNFKIILNARKKDLQTAFNDIEFLFKPSVFPAKSNIKGRVFPYTLSELKKAVEESNNKEMTEKLAFVTSKLEDQGRITDIDCTEYLLTNRQRPRVVMNQGGKGGNNNSNNKKSERTQSNDQVGQTRQNNNRQPQNFGRLYNNKDGSGANKTSSPKSFDKSQTL